MNLEKVSETLWKAVKMWVNLLLVRLGASDAKSASLQTFPTGRGFDRYPGVDWTLVVTGPWPNSMSRVLVSLNFQLTVAISLDVTGPGQPRLDSGLPPSRLVSPARCC